MKKIGFTTSIPVELVFAAGLIPVDLNNIFITSENPSNYIEKAETSGFPRNTCAWIKGIYSAILENRDIDTVVGVVEGDCSNTQALMEVLETCGISSIPFSYPKSNRYDLLKNEIEALAKTLSADMNKAYIIKKELDLIRKKLVKLDELTWKDGKVSGFENHLWQVSSSDFNGNYVKFSNDLDHFLHMAASRQPKNTLGKPQVRLGYMGVPPISADMYDFVGMQEAAVVFNEVQRQFTMVNGIGLDDLVEAYRRFTYPYTLKGRLADIKEQIQKRNIHGIIHYTQSFCFRCIEDIVVRKELDVPILTLEGDRPGGLDARTKLRIESFIDMLR